MDGVVILIAFFAGFFLMMTAIVFIGVPNIMEEHAELFCNKDGQGLLDYDSYLWTFKNITCGGPEENTVIKRNYEVEQKTYDVFIDN